jgi:hypothetical protein
LLEHYYKWAVDVDVSVVYRLLENTRDTKGLDLRERENYRPVGVKKIWTWVSCGPKPRRTALTKASSNLPDMWLQDTAQ